MAEAGVEPARRRPVSVGPSSPTRPPSPRRHSAAAATTVAGSPPLPPAAAGEDAADDFWRRRCLELSHSLQLCRAADESACLLLRHQTASLQQQMADSERKAQRAERKVRLLDHRLREVGWTSGESEEQLEALRCAVQEKDAVIGQLKCQVEEQRLLKIDETRQVEMKAAKIKEWVTGKLRDALEDKPVDYGTLIRVTRAMPHEQKTTSTVFPPLCPCCKVKCGGTCCWKSSCSRKTCSCCR